MSERDAENASVDPDALVQEALRESYLQSTEDLRYYAKKVRSFNAQKKAVRGYLAALREFNLTIIAAARERSVDIHGCDKKLVADLFTQYAHPYETAQNDCAHSVPVRVPPEGVEGPEELETEIARWEGKLMTIGDDAQLANVDLQNILQKQQQTLQMMSNISKMLHDTAMAVIRKLG